MGKFCLWFSGAKHETKGVRFAFGLSFYLTPYTERIHNMVSNNSTPLQLKCNWCHPKCTNSWLHWITVFLWGKSENIRIVADRFYQRLWREQEIQRLQMTEETVTVTISKKEHDRLIKVDKWMDALEAAGVDNWQGIDSAREML